MLQPAELAGIRREEKNLDTQLITTCLKDARVLLAQLTESNTDILQNKQIQKYLIENVQHFKKEESRNKHESSDITICGKKGNQLVKQLVIVMGQEMELDIETAGWVLQSVLDNEKHLGECLVDYQEGGYEQLALVQTLVAKVKALALTFLLEQRATVLQILKLILQQDMQTITSNKEWLTSLSHSLVQSYQYVIKHYEQLEKKQQITSQLKKQMTYEQSLLLELLYILFLKYLSPTQSSIGELLRMLIQSSFQPIVTHTFHNDETIRVYMLLAAMAGLGVATPNPNLTKDSINSLLIQNSPVYEVGLLLQVFQTHNPPLEQQQINTHSYLSLIKQIQDVNNSPLVLEYLTHVVDLDEMYDSSKLQNQYFKLLKVSLSQRETLFSETDTKSVLDSLFVKDNAHFYKVSAMHLSIHKDATIDSINYLLQQLNCVVHIDQVAQDIFQDDDHKLNGPLIIGHSQQIIEKDTQYFNNTHNQVVFHLKVPSQYLFKQLLAEWCLWISNPQENIKEKTKVKYLLRVFLNSDYEQNQQIQKLMLQTSDSHSLLFLVLLVVQTLLSAQQTSLIKLSFKVLNHFLKIQQKQEVFQVLHHIQVLNYTCNMSTYILFSLISHDNPHIDYEIVSLVLSLMQNCQSMSQDYSLTSPLQLIHRLLHNQQQLQFTNIPQLLNDYEQQQEQQQCQQTHQQQQQQQQFLDKMVDEGVYIVLNKIVERVEKKGEDENIWIKKSEKIFRLVCLMLKEETKDNWISRLNQSPLEPLINKYLEVRLESNILDQMEQLKLSWINSLLLSDCTHKSKYKLVTSILQLLLLSISLLQKGKDQGIQLIGWIDCRLSRRESMTMQQLQEQMQNQGQMLIRDSLVYQVQALLKYPQVQVDALRILNILIGQNGHLANQLSLNNSVTYQYDLYLIFLFKQLNLSPSPSPSPTHNHTHKQYQQVFLCQIIEHLLQTLIHRKEVFQIQDYPIILQSLHSLLKHHLSLAIAYRLVLLLIALHQNRPYFKDLLSKIDDQRILSQIVQYVFTANPKSTLNTIVQDQQPLSLQVASKVLLLQLFIKQIAHTSIKKQALSLVKTQITSELNSLLSLHPVHESSSSSPSTSTSTPPPLTLLESLLDINKDERTDISLEDSLNAEQLSLWSKLYHHLTIYSNNNVLYGNVIYDQPEESRDPKEILNMVLPGKIRECELSLEWLGNNKQQTLIIESVLETVNAQIIPQLKKMPCPSASHHLKIILSISANSFIVLEKLLHQGSSLNLKVTKQVSLVIGLLELIAQEGQSLADLGAQYLLFLLSLLSSLLNAGAGCCPATPVDASQVAQILTHVHCILNNNPNSYQLYVNSLHLLTKIHYNLVLDFLESHPHLLLHLLQKLGEQNCYYQENIAILKLVNEFSDEDKGSSLLQSVNFLWYLQKNVMLRVSAIGEESEEIQEQQSVIRCWTYDLLVHHTQKLIQEEENINSVLNVIKQHRDRIITIFHQPRDSYLYLQELESQSILLASVVKNSQDFFVYDSQLYHQLVQGLLVQSLALSAEQINPHSTFDHFLHHKNICPSPANSNGLSYFRLLIQLKITSILMSLSYVIRQYIYTSHHLENPPHLLEHLLAIQSATKHQLQYYIKHHKNIQKALEDLHYYRFNLNSTRSMAGLFQLEPSHHFQQILLQGLDLLIISSEIIALAFEITTTNPNDSYNNSMHLYKSKCCQSIEDTEKGIIRQISQYSNNKNIISDNYNISIDHSLDRSFFKTSECKQESQQYNKTSTVLTIFKNIIANAKV